MTYEEGTFQYRYYESTLSHVSDILQSDRNTILAAADTGIYRIDINSGHLAKILNGYSRAIYRKGNDQYMLGTSTGLFLYDSDNDNLVKLNDIFQSTVFRPDLPRRMLSDCFYGNGQDRSSSFRHRNRIFRLGCNTCWLRSVFLSIDFRRNLP